LCKKKSIQRADGRRYLAIGRALVIDPTLLIPDEPTEGIQPNIVHEIGDVIIRLRAAGLTVLPSDQPPKRILTGVAQPGGYDSWERIVSNIGENFACKTWSGCYC
jgi:ABC-type lipopolysaccharide export system ATPase subunit